MKDLLPLTDSELLALSIETPSAFGVIVDRYETAFLRRAVSVLRSKEEAEDAVQEVFVKIYVKAKTFKALEGASFSSWAYKILANECYTRYQKLIKQKRLLSPLSPEAAEIIADESVEVVAEQKFTKEYALTLISKLPLLLKRVTHLHFIDGLPQKTIAEQEGVSPEVVRTRIHRAKQFMKKYLYLYA